MTDITLDPRFQPVLDALMNVHGTYRTTAEARGLERGQVIEFLVMLDAAMSFSDKTEREKLAAMMIRNSIPTGHGDTFDDLLIELEGWLYANRQDRC